MKFFSVFIILCFWSVSIFAHHIENVRHEQSGKMINIYYDLFSVSTSECCEINVYYSSDGGRKWTGPLLWVKGDVGKNQVSGNNKLITWDALSERKDLSGNIMFEVRALLSEGKKANGTFTDRRDGNIYKYIRIGSQIWMAENMKATEYSDGTAIRLVKGKMAWKDVGSADKAYCYYNDSHLNKATYGVLYTWAAAMNGAVGSNLGQGIVQGVCPTGWHLPGDNEWKELEIYLGMSKTEADRTGYRGMDEGGQLKETGTEHWNRPNTGAVNLSGFTALPGGYRNTNGHFSNMGGIAYFWSSTEGGSRYAWYRNVVYNHSEVNRDKYFKSGGFPVRCIKD